MNEVSVVNTVVILLLAYQVFLQLRNFFKYHLTNGANRQRVIMFICAVILLVHAARHYQYRPMYFLLFYTLLQLWLYDGYGFFWRLITKPVK